MLFIFQWTVNLNSHQLLSFNALTRSIQTVSHCAMLFIYNIYVRINEICVCILDLVTKAIGQIWLCTLFCGRWSIFEFVCVLVSYPLRQRVFYLSWNEPNYLWHRKPSSFMCHEFVSLILYSLHAAFQITSNSSTWLMNKYWTPTKEALSSYIAYKYSDNTRHNGVVCVLFAYWLIHNFPMTTA